MLFTLSLCLFLGLTKAWTPESRAIEKENKLAVRWLEGSRKFRGVNLGSQFIIERWMAEDEWKTMGCGSTNDEWACAKAIGQDAADTAFTKHWASWTTKSDISQIASLGLNTVRIPVGFWIRESLIEEGEYYPRGGLKYLDRVVGWCKEAGLYVIIDLHGAPGSQTTNEQFTGHSVATPGFYTAENYERAYKFLEWMTNRIHTNGNYTTVGMLQVLNEPVHTGPWKAEAADMIETFYPGAYQRIRDAESKLGIAKADLLHIQYMENTQGKAWGSGDPRTNLTNTNYTYYDAHRYYSFDKTVPNTKKGYINAACSDNVGANNLLVGEWSLSVNSSVRTSEEFEIHNRPDQIEWYSQYWAAQAQAFERAGGWVFWAWKCNWINGIDEWRWCYKSAVAAGVIPRDAGTANSTSPC
ncbi:Glucan endo-1,6-beta-glucosidase B [Neonectria ditissima]|uniref:glucan 1,3-beta-glucosidase n=1 Tax=Neonectria ditissima TaxID=78410 RepID=A0A0P7BCV5_9HYPO|nr:Glucan endo-1,6-beta-glucosidase B [Neonectria ditissima]